MTTRARREEATPIIDLLRAALGEAEERQSGVMLTQRVVERAIDELSSQAARRLPTKS